LTISSLQVPFWGFRGLFTHLVTAQCR